MPGFIQVSKDGNGFVDGSTGQSFVPVGCNYFDPYSGWPFHIWLKYDHQRVADHLAQIAGQGLNCIRVFLDTGKLNPAPGEYSSAGFGLVDDLVSLARANNLRIIFSGPNWIEGMPQHRRGDVYGDPQQLDMLCELWQKIAQRWGNDPTVMTWDLYNEPHVEWQRKKKHINPHRLAAWQKFAKQTLGLDVGDDLPAIDPKEDPAAPVAREVYRAYLRFLDDLTENWVARQCQAIRAAGAKNMISVGIVQWSNPIMLPKGLGYGAVFPRRVAKHLDYMSQHFYPIVQSLKAGIEPEWDVQRAYLQIVARAAYVPGKPLVMEEFGWKGGRQLAGDPGPYPEEHQTQWCAELLKTTAAVACGWLNWAYADSPEPKADISGASGLWTADGTRLKHWGRYFCAKAKELKNSSFTHTPAKKVYTLDMADYLYDNAGAPSHAFLKDVVAQGHADSVEVVFKEA
ncbi:MAG: cellulase family glycosylhydrolase [Phycisphaeraceae bacterium]|nr:cellulase family glycosylhydrolase [Phycisphaeraceae bacterium]